MSSNFGTLNKTDIKMIGKGETEGAQSKFRPWIKIYKEITWLN